MNKKDRDNLCNSLISVIELSKRESKFLYDYRLNYASYRDLIYIIDNYIRNNKPSTTSYIHSYNTFSGQAFISIRQRLNIMIDKGLLRNISDNKRMLLVPTELAIKELQKLVSGE